MTGRGALVAGAPVLVIVVGAAWPPALWGGLALVLAGVVAIVFDVVRAPGARRLSANRIHDAHLSVGRTNAMSVAIGCAGRSAIALVRDQCPAEVATQPGPTWLRLPGVLAYSITPTSRGERQFGPTVIRAPGPWGLGFRQTSLGPPATALVDADLAAVRNYDALARRGRLSELGVRAHRLPGQGTEFERVREAVPDDPLRTINWRATARTGRLMAVDLIPERAQPVIICIDHGRLMGVGAGTLTKLDHAINAALLLTHAVLTSGDRAGLLTFSDRVTSTVVPKAGRAGLGRFVDAVRPLRAGELEADYDHALRFLSTWQPRRALVAIFTDVLDPDQGMALVRQCARLGRRHLPLVITIRDPAIDAAARLAPANSASVYRRSVASGLINDREDTLRILRRSGVDTLDGIGATLSPLVINRYLEVKRRARL